MKKTFLLCNLLFTFLFYSSGQTGDSSKVKHDTFDTYPELRGKQKDAKIDQLTYLDSTFNYRVKIPNWLNLRESGTPTVWGGTLPAVDGIENAIMINSFLKNSFKSFQDFEKYVVSDMVFGKPTNWSKKHICYGKNKLNTYGKLGPSYKVFIFWQNHIYHHQYILTESKTAYIWIDFTTTDKTFDKNHPKFEELMKGFSLTNF